MDGKPNTGIGANDPQQKDSLMDRATKDDVKQTARQVQNQAEQAARQARDQGRGMADDAKGKAREIGGDIDAATQGTQEKIRERAREAGNAAERMATSQMERGRHQVADTVHTVGEALRLGAEEVRQRNGGSNMQFLDRLAEPMDRVSDYLEHHDTREIAHDLESFARRNEGLFLGGAFALGVLGARFLSASSTDDMRRSDSRYASVPRESALVPQEDAVSRPGAPGYQPPRERSTMGDRPGAAGPRNW